MAQKTANHNKFFGWVPDVPDQRDFLYRRIKPVVRLPKVVDLRSHCSVVEDQGRLGSCTANALAGNLEYLDNKIDHDYSDVSRLFIYYNERVLEGSVDFDSGASLRSGIKTLCKIGYCWESHWPYLIKFFANKPPLACYEEAKSHCIQSYHRITTIAEMLTCLTEGFPFVFGFAVYESFTEVRVARTGIVPMPKKEECMLGGHAVMAVGFDNKDKRFLVRNSWGSGWGKNGYCLMPFEYLETLAQDFWTIRK